MTLTKQQHFKHFTSDVQRILYLSQMLRYNLIAIKENPLCPSFVKVDANNILNAMGRLKSDMADRGTGKNWELISADVAGDKIHSLCELLDLLKNAQNLDTVVEVIKSNIVHVTESAAAE